MYLRSLSGKAHFSPLKCLDNQRPPAALGVCGKSLEGAVETCPAGDRQFLKEMILKNIEGLIFLKYGKYGDGALGFPVSYPYR